ncbi:MAG TPA: hypothetical protein DCM45_00165, partial [Clostridiales bacterium]|nr:hypothetical protein [Clostridiales bacterium]
MIDSQLPIEIARFDQIMMQVMSAEWLRGKAYFRNRRVGNLVIDMPDAGDWSVRGEVRAADKYTVRLTFSPQWDQLTSWRCSCPQSQSWPCRHAVAMTLQTLLKQKDDRFFWFSQLVNESESSGLPTKTNVQIYFRYQKTNNQILLMPRLTKRDARGRKLMTANPLDPEDINISSLVNDRISLLRDRTDGQEVIDFFSRWSDYRHIVPGSLAFEADWDLPLLVSELLPSIPSDWQVYYDRDFEKIIPRRRAVTVDFSNLQMTSVGLLTFDLQFYCDQLAISPQQLEEYLVGQQKWLLLNGEFVEAANTAQLKILFEQISNLRPALSDDGRFSAETPAVAALIYNNIGTDGSDLNPSFKYDDSFKIFREGLAAEKANHDIHLPPLLDQLLRPYQRLGVQWLTFLNHNRLGCILADEMGL